ncbi:MAG TPA: sigma-70 family RNA polymerase sigma factor [Bacteroidia bacterium]|jgi:RNA polymerase sigma-70 factor (ECF subfamily)|nr:sigma-70 family RNA polymerase sigma factor [Bacteroidia bacterium]
METYKVLKQHRENGIKLLFEKYSKKLSIYASRTWSIEEDVAWDLIYKTIYKTADVIDRYEFQNEQKFASFIFKIFINQLRTHVRQAKTAAQGIKEVELNDLIINNYHQDSGTVSSNYLLKTLEEELSKLEDWQRILLLLRSQDMSYNDIAKYVNKPEKQLKVYYARLKQKLTERMEEIANKKKANV